MPKINIFEVQIPEDRQRKEFVKLDELALSILHTKGPIQPIVLDQDLFLIAGERRTRAMRLLASWTFCSHCGYKQEPRFEQCPRCKEQTDHNREDWQETEYISRHISSPFVRKMMEMEENLEREPLTPTEKIQAIAQLHDLYVRHHESQGFGNKWRHVDTAEKLGLSRGRVSQTLQANRVLQLDEELMDSSSESAMWAAFRKKRVEAIRAEILRRQSKSAIEEIIELHNLPGATALDLLKPETADMALFDIPYGLDVFKSLAFLEKSKKEDWNDDDEAAFVAITTLLPAVWRVLKPNTHGIIFCAFDQVPLIYYYLKKIGFHGEQPPWIWDKVYIGRNINPELTANLRYEVCIHFRKGSPALGIPLGDNIKTFKKLTQPEYPTQKPLELFEHLIQLMSPPDGLIVDPCCGSGTTGLAAYRTGRRAFLADKDFRAWNRAKWRISMEAAGKDHE